MKKVKGFTLVELIVVVAIFGIIMAAALSILQPISDVFMSTAKYENARAYSDNERLFVENNLKYATNLTVVYDVANTGADIPSDVISKADDMVNDLSAFGVGTSQNPLYVMKLANTNEGKVSIYKNSGSGFSLYNKANDEIYKNYAYEFEMPFNDNDGDGVDECVFGVSNAKLDIKIYPKKFKSGGVVELDTAYNLSTVATFSFVNLRNAIGNDGAWKDDIYLDSTGHIVDASSPEAQLASSTTLAKPYGGCTGLGTADGDIYFVYTLPKFVNEY